MNKYNKIIASFNKKKILVIGDIILDRYVQGRVSRISPEAPVPVVLEEKSFYTLGGAANVAHNLSALGAKVIQVGKIGNDFQGQILKRQLKQKGVDAQGIFLDAKMATVEKTRIIAQHQQIVRVDRETVETSGNKDVTQKILKFIRKTIPTVDAVIISDYGKGLISPELVSLARGSAIANEIPITVDPKVEHFSCYSKVTAITPNKKEVENAIRNIKIKDKNGASLGILSDKLDTFDAINTAGERLLKYLDLESLLVTLGEHGMRLYEKGKKPFVIKTRAQEVFDVTGAGDAVISVFTLALTAKATKRQAAELSNVAAGIVVGKMGAVAVTQKELLAVVKNKRRS